MDANEEPSSPSTKQSLLQELKVLRKERRKDRRDWKAVKLEFEKKEAKWNAKRIKRRDGKRKVDADRQQLEVERRQLEGDRSKLQAEVVRQKLEAERQKLEADRQKLEVDRLKLKANRSKVRLRECKLEAEAARRQLEEQVVASRQELEAAHDIPWSEWTKQKIRTQAIVYRKISSGAKSYSNLIGVTSKWKNFDENVSEHLKNFESSVDPRKAGDFKDLTGLDLNHDGIVHTMGQILLAICKYDEFKGSMIKLSAASKRYISRKKLPESTGVKGLVQGQDKADKADVEVGLGLKIILSMECKNPSWFRISKENDPKDLSTCSSDSTTLMRHRHALNQLVRYMQNRSSGYGILTSFDVSYFIRRHRKGSEGNTVETLDISDGIRWDSSSPSLIGALHYILTLAKDNMGLSYNTDPECSSTEAPEERSQESNDDDSSTCGEQDRPLSEKFPAGSTRSASEIERYTSRIGCTFLEVAEEEFLNLVPFSTGWSGILYSGKFWGHSVVVKLSHANCSRQRALDAEATIYDSLRDLWGRYIPKLVGHGTTASGDVVFLATEFLYGSTFSKTAITSAVATEARKALQALHSHGILHGDLHEENIFVLNDGVRLLDFGSSRRVADCLQCEAEMKQLELMISNQQSLSRIA